jgi:hypothetical protein
MGIEDIGGVLNATGDFAAEGGRETFGVQGGTVTDHGLSAAQGGLIGSGVSAGTDVGLAIASGISNKQSREQARGLAGQTRSDQLRTRDERDALARVDLRQRGESQDITHRRQNSSMRYQQFQNYMQKRQTNQETSNGAIARLGENMQKNEALKDMVLKTYNREG